MSEKRQIVCTVTLLLAAELNQVQDEIDVHLTDAQFATIGFQPGTNAEQTEVTKGVTPAVVMLGLQALLDQLRKANKAQEPLSKMVSA